MPTKNNIPGLDRSNGNQSPTAKSDCSALPGTTGTTDAFCGRLRETRAPLRAMSCRQEASVPWGAGVRAAVPRTLPPAHCARGGGHKRPSRCFPQCSSPTWAGNCSKWTLCQGDHAPSGWKPGAGDPSRSRSFTSPQERKFFYSEFFSQIYRIIAFICLLYSEIIMKDTF